MLIDNVVQAFWEFFPERVNELCLSYLNREMAVYNYRVMELAPNSQNHRYRIEHWSHLGSMPKRSRWPSYMEIITCGQEVPRWYSPAMAGTKPPCIVVEKQILQVWEFSYFQSVMSLLSEQLPHHRLFRGL